MSTFQIFSLILGISLCFLTSAFNTKETVRSKEDDHKIEMKLIEKFEYLNQRIDTMEANQLTGRSVIDQIRTNVEKLMNMVEQGFKKMEKCEIQSEKVDQNVKNVIKKTDESVNVCSPNPCNGGQCKVNATGSGYSCTYSNNATYGTHCLNSKGERDHRCLLYKDTVYFVFESQLSWEEADRKCVAEGMTLAMPKEQETNEWLVSQLRPIYGYAVIKRSVWLWMGLKSNVDGVWRWTDGSPLMEYTGGNEYFKNFTGQHCGLMYFSGGSSLWYPNPCTNPIYPLCEKRVN